MGKSIAILVIDDEQLVADALEMILLDLGYEVTVAMSGGEGLQRLDEQEFDIVICDLRLPDMTGLDVLGYLQRKGLNSKAIIITAHSTPDVIAESRRLGALGLLSKPFLTSDILKLIDLGLNSCHSLKHNDHLSDSA